MAHPQYIDLPRAQCAAGTMQLPGSKSISNRVLLLAALAEGRTRISGLLDSDDTRVMLDALAKLGVAVLPCTQESAMPAPTGASEPVPAQASDSVEVTGKAGAFGARAELFMGNAGTAIRPLTAVLAIHGGDFTLSGVPRMHERPIGDLVDALQALGARVDYLGTPGYPPLRIGAFGTASTEPVKIQGSVSSQFLTSLLMAGPLFTARTGAPLRIEVEGELISKPYIAITLNLMARFGVIVQQEGWQSFTISAQAQYRSPGAIRIEGDASSASYFLALGAIGGGPVTVSGVDRHSIQGDIAFADTLCEMGATVTAGEGWLRCSGVNVARGETLRAFDADFNLIPDAAMTAAALALFADGPCQLRNIGSWRVKETDRIHAMRTELTKLGATVEEGDDWLAITPPGAGQWRDAAIDTWDDHRMAMCFSLAAFGPAAIRIMDPGCVAKTFPTYFDVYGALVSSEGVVS